jgi:hypothetical protein
MVMAGITTLTLSATVIRRLIEFPIMLYVFYYALRRLKKNHAAEIYLIWYIFSLFFVLMFGLQFIAEWRGVNSTQVCGAYQETCDAAIRVFIGIDDELLLLFVLLSLAIIPQLLAYFLSGLLSGTASTPKFVRQIQTIAMWSLIKFLAGFGGIFSAPFFAMLAAGKLWDDESATLLFLGVCVTIVAFSLASVQIAFAEGMQILKARAAIKRIHAFFTRNLHE